VKDNGHIFDATSAEDLVGKLALILENDKKLSGMKNRPLEVIGRWSYKQILDAIENWLLQTFSSPA